MLHRLALCVQATKALLTAAAARVQTERASLPASQASSLPALSPPPATAAAASPSGSAASVTQPLRSAASAPTTSADVISYDAAAQPDATAKPVAKATDGSLAVAPATPPSLLVLPAAVASTVTPAANSDQDTVRAGSAHAAAVGGSPHTPFSFHDIMSVVLAVTPVHGASDHAGRPATGTAASAGRSTVSTSLPSTSAAVKPSESPATGGGTGFDAGSMNLDRIRAAAARSARLSTFASAGGPSDSEDDDDDCSGSDDSRSVEGDLSRVSTMSAATVTFRKPARRSDRGVPRPADSTLSPG